MSFVITIAGTTKTEEIQGRLEGASKAYLVDSVNEDEEFLNDIVEAFSETISRGEVLKVGVIVNTVRRAQDFYSCLEAWLEEVGILDKVTTTLFHSRFTVGDRARKEAELFSLVGKGVSPTKSVLVVATQVVEQSLDIDFDVMWTDVAPVENLIQRCGRVHRHNNLRPTEYDKAYIHVISSPEARESSSKLYGVYPVVVASRWAETVSRFSFDEIKAMVDGAYSQQDVFANEYAQWEWALMEKRGKAEVFRISVPESVKTRTPLYGWLESNISDIEAEAKVRDGDSGPTFVLVVQDEDGLRTPDGFRLNLQDTEISFTDQKRILKSSIVFPRMKSADIADTINNAERNLSALLDQWNQTALLKGEVPYLMEGEAEEDYIASALHVYSYERGLEKNEL